MGLFTNPTYSFKISKLPIFLYTPQTLVNLLVYVYFGAFWLYSLLSMRFITVIMEVYLAFPNNIHAQFPKLSLLEMCAHHVNRLKICVSLSLFGEAIARII